MFSSFFNKYSPILRFVVREKSMEPYLREGMNVIGVRYFYAKPKEGDVVIFSHTTPPFLYVKRIVKMDKNKIWMEGDNKKISIDSRVIGWIDKKNIVGRVIFII